MKATQNANQEGYLFLLGQRLSNMKFPESKSNKKINIRSGIKSLDIESLLKEPCMSNDKIECLRTKQVLENDLNEIKICLGRKQNTCIPSSFMFQNHKVSNSHTVEQHTNKKRILEQNTLPNFITAREEFNTQNLNKYGFNYQGNMNGNSLQKRKLGTTNRGVSKKFVSPLIGVNTERSNSSDDISCPGDDRLQNIDPQMIELIKSEIMHIGSPVGWEDIAGLRFAKSAIQEAVIWPMLRPDIFTGLRRPPKGILLFGPPGTGKTLIGKCVASQSGSTFFSISASSLTSKWIGDGEKMVRALFAVARYHQPAVIFIDEVDSLLSQRSDTEHESSRRIKTEFLVQLDGATTENEERLLLIGATNRPQELDEAARRRFVKRLYIPLPDYDARLELIMKLISGEKHQMIDNDFKEIALSSSGYSGADIKNLCSEAALGPIRSIHIDLISKIQPGDVRPLTIQDFQKAFSRVKSSISPNDLKQYDTWNETYGCGF